MRTELEVGRNLIATAVLASAALLANAQHSDRPQDLAEGAELFKANCVLCHGIAGNAVAGVDLRGGKFRNAVNDDDLIRIIREGIGGTAMPAFQLSAAQAANILSHLRSSGRPIGPTGSEQVARGRAIVEGKGQCLSCHQIGGKGNAVGPYLDDIGGLRRRPELEKDLLEPNARVPREFRRFRGLTRSGVALSGRAINEDTFSVQITDDEDRLISIMKSDLREFSFVNDSPMPSYRHTLSSMELADVVAYLASLTGL